MRTIATQAMHPQQSDGRWINVPQDMGKHYQRLGWTVRELVDRAEAQKTAEDFAIAIANGCATVLEDA